MTVSFPTFERGCKEIRRAPCEAPSSRFKYADPNRIPNLFAWLSTDGPRIDGWGGPVAIPVPGTWQSLSEALHGSRIGSRCAGVALLLGPDLAGDVDETETLADTLAEPRVDAEREHPLSRSVQPFGAELPVR